MIRVGTQHSGRPLGRRQVFRAAFAGLAGLAGLEIAGALAPFLKVNRVVGLGVPVAVGPLAAILERFAATNDAPILFREGHFFLLHAPARCSRRIASAPISAARSPMSRRRTSSTAPVINPGTTSTPRSSPAGRLPSPCKLFHISAQAGQLIVDTNPLNVIDRPDNRWDPAVIEIGDLPA